MENFIRNNLFQKNILILLIFTFILITPFFLTPDKRGFGTHEEIYLPPCTFHALTGLPCPACGLTTSFTYMARFEIKKAFLTHPFGALLFISLVGLFFFSIINLFRRKNLNLKRINWSKVGYIIFILVSLSWIYKLVTTIWKIT